MLIKVLVLIFFIWIVIVFFCKDVFRLSIEGFGDFVDLVFLLFLYFFFDNNVFCINRCCLILESVLFLVFIVVLSNFLLVCLFIEFL